MWWFMQGGHPFLEVLEFYFFIFQGPWKTLKAELVLENPWISLFKTWSVEFVILVQLDCKLAVGTGINVDSNV